MGYVIDIDIDWNEEDETGLPWTMVSRAAFPGRIMPGAFVVAGRGSAVAVAEVVDRGEGGVVHLRALHGSVSENAHRLGIRHPA